MIDFQMKADSWLIYGVSIFLKYPKFDCFWASTGEWIDDNSQDYTTYCAPSHFCTNDDVLARIDTESNVSLANWI